MKIRTHLAMFCVLTLLLTFTACKPSTSADNFSNTTETNTTPVFTGTGNTTHDTTEPTDEPSQPGAQEQNQTHRFPFIYDGRQPYPHGPELDLSKLMLGYLYTHDKDTNVLCLIADTEVSQMDTTDDYIYYLIDEGSKVVRSDYTGGNQAVIYNSENDITWFDYNADKLLIVENKKKMRLIDLTGSASEVILEQFCINEAFYHPDASDFTSEDKGRTIQWYGQSTETDELNCYIYHMDINEMYNPTWH